LSTLSVWCEEVSIVVEVADVEELVVGEAVSAPELEVRLDVVEVAEAGGEFDVRFVVEAGVAKDADTILDWFVSLFSRSNVVTMVLIDQAEQITLAIAERIRLNISSGRGLEKSTPRTSAPNVGWSSLISSVSIGGILCSTLRTVYRLSRRLLQICQVSNREVGLNHQLRSVAFKYRSSISGFGRVSAKLWVLVSTECLIPHVGFQTPSIPLC
jgi:hypothetical protein